LTARVTLAIGCLVACGGQPGPEEREPPPAEPVDVDPEVSEPASVAPGLEAAMFGLVGSLYALFPPDQPVVTRRRAAEALAFTDTPDAAAAMLDVASGVAPLRDTATWWLLSRSRERWAAYDLLPRMKAAGIYDPATATLRDAPAFPRLPDAQGPVLADVVAASGDASRGRTLVSRCVMCHVIGGTGVDLGPGLDGWARGKRPDIVALALLDPDAGIAHGYTGTALRTTDGLTIEGLLLADGDPLMMRSMGGLTQVVPADRVAQRATMTRSLMPRAADLGLSAQDVADLIAFLRASVPPP